MMLRHSMACLSLVLGLFFAAACPAQQATNPVLHADVPDISVLRVGDTYYMSSTTMHMCPGLPIMKSKDLVNWEMLNYAYQTLGDADDLSLENGKHSYGLGTWASSLRYHNGTYYVTTFARNTNKTYVFSTPDIERVPWKRQEFSPALHDHTLFFDDDGKVYMLYGVGKLRLVELESDLSGIKQGGFNQIVIDDASAPAGNNMALHGEGSQMFKVDGKYYLFNIAWPRGGMRTVVVHRADKITGPYEGRLGLQDKGVAQGGMVDTPDGRWFAYLFQDHGSVGRTPFMVPMTWEEGWPVLGVEGKVPMQLDLPANKSLIPGIVDSDEFDRQAGDESLPLVWQWNHNPDDEHWSLAERPGFLRITTKRLDRQVVEARNMLTQRTIGPTCTGSVAVDATELKPGDYAGLCLLQKDYGYVAVKATAEGNQLVMVNAGGHEPQEVETIDLKQAVVHLRAECDFRENIDHARFFYSLDGKAWQPIGDELQMSYTLPHFMGYRFGLFNYSTQQAGGHADFDYFHIEDKLSSQE